MSANWGNVQQGLESGYKIGRSAGGKLSGLGMALSKIVESMRETRVANEVQGRQQNLLGYASGLRMAEAQTKEALKPKTQDIVSDTGEIVGKRPAGSVFRPAPKERSYAEQKRIDTNFSVEKIRSGQSNFQTERKNLLSKYPDISWDTLQNLNEIGKMYKPEIVKKQKEQNIASKQLRYTAIQELKKAGYPNTENNIKNAMEQLRNK